MSDKCPLAEKCVLTAIEDDSKILSSKTEKEGAKLTALKSLGHWVGDIHQPLHVSFEDDAGGNTIRVSGQCLRNLHAAWDDCLVQYAVGPDVAEAVTDLINAITLQTRMHWNDSSPRDWMNESFAISTNVKTAYCVRRGSSCERPDGVIQIDAGYLDANELIVKVQLQKAGVRLAHILDQAFQN
jgi:hypothetical protein